MPRAKKKERSMDLYEHIASLNTVEECCRFFDDLCAITELRAMEQRFDVAKMLHAGRCTRPSCRRQAPVLLPSVG